MVELDHLGPDDLEIAWLEFTTVWSGPPVTQTDSADLDSLFDVSKQQMRRWGCFRQKHTESEIDGSLFFFGFVTQQECQWFHDHDLV